MNRRIFTFAITTTLAAWCVAPSAAQVLQEDFDTVTGSGGATVLSGSGFNEVFGWDTGILAENAFAGTIGNTQIGAATAFGAPSGGVGGSGAGVIDVAGVQFNIFAEDFAGVLGVGGGVFLAPDGNDPNGAMPNTFNFTLNWDDGISGERAFGGTANGAILRGSMSAQGLTGGTGSGQLIVDDVDLLGGNWYAGMEWEIGSFPGATPLANTSFEDNGGSLNGWEVYSAGFNVLADTAKPVPLIEPRTGNTLCKMFGRFSGVLNNSGIFQRLPAEAGQVWQLDVYSRHNLGDAISGTSNYMVMKIEFWDPNDHMLLVQEATILDPNSPTNVWIDNTPLQVTAPAGTSEVRPVFEFVQPSNQGGAGHLDDASFKLVGGPSTVNLADYSMTADISGVANTGAGEALGDVQLRVEDTDGNRLFFRQQATGGSQPIGGALSAAIEADANGTPAAGVFNANSPSFRVVLAFDNDDAHPWGTGGTLNVDNILVGNTDPSNSGWYAGLFWDGLTITSGDPNNLALTADILGNVVGGAYELRVEAFDVFDAGLNETFDGATGAGGGVFLDPNGGGFGFTTDWDDGITGEAAFGGVAGSVEFPSGGFSAQAVMDPNSGSMVGEIRVENLIIGPGGAWYAGLEWGNQGLASTDLGAVTLTANVTGLALGGGYGDYEMRIEDAQGDRMYFSATATGGLQSIGGPLSSATEGPALSGAGDGTFNLDSPSYTVVIAFRNEVTSWGSGGVLRVDNLFLTPVQVRNEIGRVTFNGVADGTFQPVGDLLKNGISTFGDYTEGFDAATGTGGGFYGPGNAGNWDNGLANENAFFGFGGDAAIDPNEGGAIAQACATCGVGGGPGGQLIVQRVYPNTGAWWAGLFFENVPANLTGNPAEIFLRADVTGTADTGAGQSLGTYFIRIEDSDLTVLSYTLTANGSLQTIGGSLLGATLEQIENGDGVFNYGQGSYTVTIGFVGEAGNWGPGGRLDVDNLFLTGVKFRDADSYTVTATYANELATWGTDGTLTIDNLSLGAGGGSPCGAGCEVDANGDADVNDDCVVDLTDLAILLSAFDVTPAGDTDGDGDTDLTDLARMLALFDATCP